MRLSSDGFHDIHLSVSLFFVVLFRKVTPGNILIRYGGNSMEEGDGPLLLSKTMTVALSYQSLYEECGALLLGGHIEQDRFFRSLDANPF